LVYLCVLGVLVVKLFQTMSSGLCSMLESFQKLFRPPPKMLPMRERSVRCISPHGMHRMAYVEWGDPQNTRVLLCVHGLTRNSRDFDFLAQALAADYRVVCPDVVGRGRSDWLTVSDGYALPQYVSDMVTLIARLDADQVDWVGTSMGGLIGMLLAGRPDAPIRRMVLNDVGPLLTGASMRRIAEYVGKSPLFADMDEAQKYIRAICAPFGRLTDVQWKHLATHGVRRRDDGQLELNYDRAIAEPFHKAFLFADVDLWPVYDAIRSDTLVLRGTYSDILSADTLAQMALRGPRARTLEIADVGHAPALMNDEQIAAIRSFLLAP
jgi:pimeloyl-ACP methyl ester carboxylesterase